MALAGGSGCLGDCDPLRTNLLIHSASLSLTETPVLRVGRCMRTFAGGRGGTGRTVTGVTVPVAAEAAGGPHCPGQSLSDGPVAVTLQCSGKLPLATSSELECYAPAHH